MDEYNNFHSSKTFKISISNVDEFTQNEESNDNNKIINFFNLLNQKVNIMKDKEKDPKSQEQVKVREKLHRYIDSSMIVVDNLIKFISIINNEKFIGKKTIEDLNIMQKDSDLFEEKKINYMKKLHYMNKSCESLKRSLEIKEINHLKSQFILEKLQIIKKYYFTISEDMDNLSNKKIYLSNLFFKKFERFYTKSKFDEKFTFYLEVNNDNQQKLDLTCDYINNLTRFPKFEMEIFINKDNYKFNIDQILDSILLKPNEYLFRRVEERGLHYVDENPLIFAKSFSKVMRLLLYKLIKIEFYSLLEYFSSNFASVNNFYLTLTHKSKKYEFLINNGEFFKMKFVMWKEEENKVNNDDSYNYMDSNTSFQKLESSVKMIVSDILHKIKYETNLNVFKNFTSYKEMNSYTFENLYSSILTKNLLKFSKSIFREQLIKHLNSNLQRTNYTVSKNENISILGDNYSYNYLLVPYKLVANEKATYSESKTFSISFIKNQLFMKLKKKLGTNILLNENNLYTCYCFEEWSYDSIMSIISNYLDSITETN